MDKLFSAETIAEHVTYIRPKTEVDRHVAVLYLHGGGLVFGSREDLPEPYVRMFLEAGYTLVALDYPLAPEASLGQINDFVFDAWQWLIARTQLAGHLRAHVLFGRSAGAYLILVLAARIMREAAKAPDPKVVPLPAAILDYYGFYNLSDPAFFEASKRHSALARVTQESLAPELASSVPKFSARLSSRYNIYVYARQNPGAWLRFMGLTASDGSLDTTLADKNSLSEAELVQLPPTFITASTSDGDVPYRISKQLKRLLPNSKLHTVYYLDHDFDRDTSNPAGTQAYRAAIRFLNEHV